MIRPDAKAEKVYLYPSRWTSENPRRPVRPCRIHEPTERELTCVCGYRKHMKPGTVPHRFRKWVTAEVLPSIRKTGRYATEASALAPDIQLLSAQRWITTFDTQGNQYTRLLPMDKCIMNTAEFIDHVSHLSEHDTPTPQLLQLTM